MTYQITRSEARALVPIFEAFGGYKTIQRAPKTAPTRWHDCCDGEVITPIPSVYIYRVKAGPVSRPFKTLEEVVPYIGKLVRWTSTSAQMITGAHFSDGTLLVAVGSDIHSADTLYRAYCFIDSGKPVGYYEED